MNTGTLHGGKPIASSGVTLSLTGRTALITGGSRGIGRAIAERFLQAGASVIITARRPDVLAATKADLERIAPGNTTTHVCDVSDKIQVSALCEALHDGKRDIDVLVNNAGSSSTGKFEDLTDERWQSDFDLKLFAAIRLVRFVYPGMKARKWGRILNVVSIIGKTPGAEGAPTCVSRAAGIALSKVLASEFGRHGILVNALCTGRIVSDQLERRWTAKGGGKPFDEWVREQTKPIPLGRIGNAGEYANVALFLASDAGSYVTGAAINIDGGLCHVT
jgi:NAD(P)-dependent dehydrogenase (short-subunit alcohol dehydrogenase family)